MKQCKLTIVATIVLLSIAVMEGRREATTPVSGPFLETTLSEALCIPWKEVSFVLCDKKADASVGDTGNEELNAMCDEILASLVSDSMSEREKAHNIYTWVTSSIRYKGNFDMSDWKKGAITALKKRRGNCFAFYSASRALLTRAGLENIEIKEEPDVHFWNMVKVDGNWYHFDATRGWGADRFLWTDKQMRKYRHKLRNGRCLRYKWDASKYPATPE